MSNNQRDNNRNRNNMSRNQSKDIDKEMPTRNYRKNNDILGRGKTNENFNLSALEGSEDLQDYLTNDNTPQEQPAVDQRPKAKTIEYQPDEEEK